MVAGTDGLDKLLRYSELIINTGRKIAVVVASTLGSARMF